MWSLLGAEGRGLSLRQGLSRTLPRPRLASKDPVSTGYRAVYRRYSHRLSGDGQVKLVLDLHDIYNRGRDIDRALRDIMDEAVRKKAPLVEIIPGKGSGQLKKHVLRFLQQKEVKALYHRVEKDSKNFGRVFVHFRW
jgi:DNA-nicking Smr family endonuclease